MMAVLLRAKHGPINQGVWVQQPQTDKCDKYRVFGGCSLSTGDGIYTNPAEVWQSSVQHALATSAI